MKKLIFAMAAVAVAFMTGCSEEEVKPEIKDGILVAPEGKSFSAKGGTVDVIVTSSGQWHLSGDYSWVDVTASEGIDGDIVRFTVRANDTEDKRTAEYSFVCGTAEAPFVITCAEGEKGGPAAESISLFPESFGIFAPEGETRSLMVTSSAEWSLEPEDEYVWVTPSALSGKDGDQVDFEVDANGSSEQRTAKFVFRCGDARAEVSVEQGAVAYSMELVSSSEIGLPQGGGETVIMLAVSNITERDIRCDIEDTGWLRLTTVLPGDESGQLKVVLNADENTLPESRSASVRISGPGNTAAEVSITQAQKDRIETAGDLTIYVGLEGGSIEIPVISNVEYTVTPSASWITHTGKKGDNECFTVTANGSDRSGSIEFKGGTASLSVRIEQKKQALIGQVAYMNENWAWPAWTDPAPVTDMDTFTLEAYIKCDLYNLGQISTIMGIEGKFLIRFGDGRNSMNSTNLYLIYDGGELLIKNFIPMFENNRWYHIAVTFDRGSIKTYLNGQPAPSASSSSSYVNFGIPHQGTEVDGLFGRRFFWVGYSYEEGRSFNGLMSEVRIWNKALSQAEIQAENHFYHVEPDADGLVAYWKFNETSGAMSIKDWTRYGNDMQLHAPLVSEKVSLP